jgi:hypothetical protein
MQNKVAALLNVPTFSLQISTKREPTSGLKNRLPLPQLRVIIHSLQGFAQPCKSPISKRLSPLWFAACCAVLRSRWYQSGINMTLVSAWAGLLLRQHVLERLLADNLVGADLPSDRWEHHRLLPGVLGQAPKRYIRDTSAV